MHRLLLPLQPLRLPISPILAQISPTTAHLSKSCPWSQCASACSGSDGSHNATHTLSGFVYVAPTSSGLVVYFIALQGNLPPEDIITKVQALAIPDDVKDPDRSSSHSIILSFYGRLELSITLSGQLCGRLGCATRISIVRVTTARLLSAS
ncbi:hypothetical protein JOM56_014158 [Amanita muscaria]